ncbi:ADP-ribose glycohydrolase MACROD2 isoform X2 [Melanotaenia boesemani]|uniref:ADP-ribose glycohydrolase MACROD2 isoform X2 n=1 Tax=Melanotaenia boesemani TaxID=1250792 RepID=UPI001C03FFC3|nr:ADP-ribose glycohydrolase MACROD2 isoform X2 [Melanotaenia boesemani]
MSKKKKDWKTEKERLLRLDREERRKDYRRQDFIPLDKISTWREENISNDRGEEEELTGGGWLSDKVSLYKGDITVLEVDAIVNAANSSLLGGGGVDGCIHKAAGSCLYDECYSLNGCETGKAKITCGYDLPARYVIHTVGPVARGHVGPSEKCDLTSCYQNSLDLMTEHGLTSVAFPCISTGIYGFPNEPAADIALSTVKNWIEKNPDKITRVIFCVFLETDFGIYKKKMSVIFQDNTPPSTKSTTKEEIEDSNRDVELNEDVEMASQTPDENLPNVEPNQEQCDDEHENQDKAEDLGTDNENDNSEEKGIDNNNDEDKDEEKSAAKKEDDNTAKPTVEMEDLSEINNDTSNGEEIKDDVEGSQETDTVPPKGAGGRQAVCTCSSRAKSICKSTLPIADPAEKKE